VRALRSRAFLPPVSPRARHQPEYVAAASGSAADGQRGRASSRARRRGQCAPASNLAGMQ
jgi:hypothetical protein